MAESTKSIKPVEGMRARKRRQTRERIVNAALQLFSAKGFDAVTVDEIAATADVSKRSFFDYFPAKEDVIFAWQDDFGKVLAAAIAARPARESPVRTVDVKYARLEQTLAEALMVREKSARGKFRAQLLAAIVIAGMRLGNEQWYREGKTDSSNAMEFTKRIFRLVWNELYEIGDAGRQQREANR